MTQDELAEKMRHVAYLAGCVVRGVAPDAARLADADPDGLLEAASRSSLSAICAAGLEAAGIKTHATQQKLASGILRATQFEADWQPVRAAMEAAGIWYCPLKGAVIKDCYPAYGLRQMADYDVLFDADRAADLRDIMVGMGFSSEHYGTSSHDVYHKLPVSNFEMHRRLFSPVGGLPFADYFADIKTRLIKDADNGFGWHMSLEDCYLYVLAHGYKHYSVCGTGLRSALDVYVYLHAFADDMDWDVVLGTAREIGLADFEERQRTFAEHLFEDVPLTPEEEELFFFMATSGTYGNPNNRVKNALARMKNKSFAKLRYVWDRLFPPLDDAYSAAYPFFGKHKWLLPVFYVYRLGHALRSRGRTVIAEFVAVIRAEK